MNQKFDTNALIEFCRKVLFSEILPRVSQEGCVLTKSPNGNQIEDHVTTHHYVELMLELDSALYADAISKAVMWFRNKKRSLHNPFYISTLAETNVRTQEDKREIAEKILSQARPSGIIDFFTGFTEGSLLFSTAWAVKILLRLQDGREYEGVIEKAFNAIEELWDDIENNSLKGAFLELLLSYRSVCPDAKERCDARVWEIVDEIIEQQEIDGTWDKCSNLGLLYTAYVIGNLCMLDREDSRVVHVIETALQSLVTKDKSSNSLQLSEAIFDFRSKVIDSNYVQLLLRIIISISRYLNLRKSKKKLVIGLVSTSLQKGIEAQKRLAGAENKIAKLMRCVEPMERKFASYQSILEKIWRNYPYDKTVFIMMPFRDTTIFRTLTNTIKETCRKRGYTSIRTDDTDRQFSPHLWENLLINMLSARYAIAIYVDEVASGLIKREEVLFFQNPNVALEFGFFTSRGRDIMILKDAGSDLPSNLQGFIYKPFDINNPDRTVPEHVNTWLDILERE